MSTSSSGLRFAVRAPSASTRPAPPSSNVFGSAAEGTAPASQRPSFLGASASMQSSTRLISAALAEDPAVFAFDEEEGGTEGRTRQPRGRPSSGAPPPCRRPCTSACASRGQSLHRRPPEGVRAAPEGARGPTAADGGGGRVGGRRPSGARRRPSSPPPTRSSCSASAGRRRRRRRRRRRPLTPPPPPPSPSATSPAPPA